MIIVYERGEKEKIKNGVEKFPLKTVYLDDMDEETYRQIDNLALEKAKEEVIKNRK